MSKRTECHNCGELMDVPAFPGDGVYTEHHCSLDVLSMHQRSIRRELDGWTDDDDAEARHG